MNGSILSNGIFNLLPETYPPAISFARGEVPMNLYASTLKDTVLSSNDCEDIQYVQLE
jgi:hypothetical protein